MSKIDNLQQPKANLKVKDSVFRSLFSEKENVLDLYRYLHPEDTTTTAADINIVTLENILAVDRVNDLGFSVGNHLLILVEAQTNWSINILVRSLLYYAETIKNHLARSKQDIFSTSRVDLPAPELYVVYTGPERKLSDEISLKSEFFPDSNSSLEVKLKIIYNREYKETDNVFLQYLKFLSVLYEVLSTEDNPGRENVTAYKEYRLKAITKAVDYCIANNILRDFLIRHRSEVTDIMSYLFSSEEIDKLRIDAAEARGEARGRTEGVVEGKLTELVKNLQSLIAKNIEPNKAMDLLDVPQEDRPKLLSLLSSYNFSIN